MKFLKGLSNVLSYIFAWVTVWTYKQWIINRYVHSQFEGNAHQWAFEINERSIVYGAIFFGLFLLFRYLSKKKLDFLPLGLALTVCGLSCILEFGNYQHEGLKALGIKTGVGSLLFGISILAIRFLKEKGKNKGALDLGSQNSTDDNAQTYSTNDEDVQQLSMVDNTKSNTEINNNVDEKTKSYFKNHKDIESKMSKPNKLSKKAPVKKLIVIMVLIVAILTVYFNFFYYPHDGRWETELYSREILLKVDKGEGIFKIGNTKGYDVLIFEPNKKNTTIGINGSSNKIDINKGVLMIELNNLYTSELGESNEVLYFKKK